MSAAVVFLPGEEFTAITVQDIIDHYGTPKTMAERLGVKVQLVYMWKKWGYISSNQCDIIERDTGGKFSAAELRTMFMRERGRRLYQRV